VLRPVEGCRPSFETESLRGRRPYRCALGVACRSRRPLREHLASHHPDKRAESRSEPGPRQPRTIRDRDRGGPRHVWCVAVEAAHRQDRARGRERDTQVKARADSSWYRRALLEPPRTSSRAAAYPSKAAAGSRSGGTNTYTNTFTNTNTNTNTNTFTFTFTNTNTRPGPVRVAGPVAADPRLHADVVTPEHAEDAIWNITVAPSGGPPSGGASSANPARLGPRRQQPHPYRPFGGRT